MLLTWTVRLSAPSADLLTVPESVHQHAGRKGDLDRLQRRVCVNVKFNKASAISCMWVRVIQITNPKLGRKWFDSSFAEEDLNV